MAYRALNDTCILPSVVDDIIISYIAKPKWTYRKGYKVCVELIKEMDEDVLMFLTHIKGPKECKKYYTIY